MGSWKCVQEDLWQTDLGLWSGAVAKIIRLVMSGLAGPAAKRRQQLTGNSGNLVPLLGSQCRMGCPMALVKGDFSFQGKPRTIGQFPFDLPVKFSTQSYISHFSLPEPSARGKRAPLRKGLWRLKGRKRSGEKES